MVHSADLYDTGLLFKVFTILIDSEVTSYEIFISGVRYTAGLKFIYILPLKTELNSDRTDSPRSTCFFITPSKPLNSNAQQEIKRP